MMHGPKNIKFRYKDYRLQAERQGYAGEH